MESPGPVSSRRPWAIVFRFRALLGRGEQIAVWVDGRLVYADGLPDRVGETVRLTAGHRHRLRIEYVNPDGRAEIRLLWSSLVIDPSPSPQRALYPEA